MTTTKTKQTMQKTKQKTKQKKTVPAKTGAKTKPSTAAKKQVAREKSIANVRARRDSPAPSRRSTAAASAKKAAARTSQTTTPKAEDETCNVMRHFTCSGTGQICNICGESESACACADDDQDLHDCDDCEGAGFICTTHESPVRSTNLRRCEAANAKQTSQREA